VAVSGFAVVLVLVVVLTDWLSAAVSGFWSGHAMLTNLVSSGVFAFLTVASGDQRWSPSMAVPVVLPRAGTSSARWWWCSAAQLRKSRIW